MKGVCAISILAVFLSGCAAFNSEPWPKAGAGGMAEMSPAADDVAWNLRARVDAARLRGAEQFAAMDFAQAQLLLNRLERERAAQLYIDAEEDATRLQGLMTSVERALPASTRSIGGSAGR